MKESSGRVTRLLTAHELEERKEASSEVVACACTRQRGAQELGVSGNCRREAAKRCCQRTGALESVAWQRRG